ncbi:MAG: hypothetical protein A3E36_00670 [Candidatus Andersenbacteria bacterium RIFCSPHIGHO2_12_FULL_45_11b]|uniref:Uncharacterized protein n=1 Tax=Candidatus Andersenbacteria bacterium RIFCSPHIGHO2_12_FULL_45_11b TaxID=1797282 RepID=A0A1G1X5B5_9BACT|nr:MAG: hypothetical protein A3E36_00670 [Candidatus Andersenbacteria bacterium RIFCSPHIGHO2_12_FULL_45_11b]
MTPTITALGTGCADSTKYFQTAFLIQDEHTNLLIDTGGGSGILSQLDKCDIDLNSIQNIFITHKHIDHIFGVFWILRFRGANIANGKADNITIYASAKNIALIKQVSGIFLKEKVIALFDSKIRFIAVDKTANTKINDWGLEFFDIQSKKEEQFGCHIRLPTNKTIAFIGDEPYTDAILPHCKNIDYFFHDSYCLEKDRDIFHPEEISHSTAKEAGANAQKVQAKNLILFHTEDKLTFGNRKELYAAEAKKEFSGNVFVPDDGDVIEVVI